MYSGFRKHFYNTSWQLFSQLLRLTSSLLIGTLVARYLGPLELGKLNFAIAFVSIASAVAPLGLDTIVLRELVKDRERSGVFLGSAFVLKLIASFLTYLVVVLFLSYASFDRNTEIMILVLLGMSFFQSFNVLAVYFQSEIDGKSLGYSCIISVLMSSTAKLLLLFGEKSVMYFSLVYLFDSIVLAVSYLYFYSQKQRIQDWKVNVEVAKDLLRDSFPLLLGGIVVLVYMRVDQVMLKFLVGDASVGVYSVAVSLSEVWYFVPTVISTAIFPAIVNAKKHDAVLYNVRIQRLLTLMLWISVVFAVTTFLFSDWIINLLYGPKFSDSAVLLQIMAFTGVFVSLGVSSAKWYIIENLQVLFFKRSLYGLAINIILNLFLIPKYGGTGAAIATLVSYFVSSFLFDLFAIETRELFYMKLKAPYAGVSKRGLLGLISR